MIDKFHWPIPPKKKWPKPSSRPSAHQAAQSPGAGPVACVTWPYQVLGNVRAEAVRRNVARCHTGNPASCVPFFKIIKEMEEGSEALHIPSLCGTSIYIPSIFLELPSNLQLFNILHGIAALPRSCWIQLWNYTSIQGTVTNGKCPQIHE